MAALLQAQVAVTQGQVYSDGAKELDSAINTLGGVTLTYVAADTFTLGDGTPDRTGLALNSQHTEESAG